MTGFADELFPKICAGCIADFNGGFPDFCTEELKKRWAGKGHCLRCNVILDPQSIPDLEAHWRKKPLSPDERK